MHTHSEGALQITTNMNAGHIISELKHKLFKPMKQQPEEFYEKEQWKLISKKSITSNLAIFQFRSPNYKLSAILPYFENCGQYFTVFL